MRVKLKADSTLMEGLSFLTEDMNFILVDNNEDILVEAVPCGENTVKVEFGDKSAKITYGGGKSRFYRGFALLMEAIADGKDEFSICEAPHFVHNGAMYTGNIAPVSVSALKMYMRKMALMGLDTMQIYTEDNLDIPGYEYAGHMRGKYTAEEFKELDSYALTLGIELIPCLELAGHLSYFLRGVSAAPYRDTADCLLVGADETYAFIESIFKMISECFTTKRVHIGCDEAFSLGTGVYRAKNGVRDQLEIFMEHIVKIHEIAQKYGFKLMMWSDMLFSTQMKKMNENRYPYSADVNFPQYIHDNLPVDMDMVYWEYSSYDEAFHDGLFEKHKELDRNIIFAGGIKVWQSSCPQYHESLKCMLPGLRACVKHGVDEILLTIWCLREISPAAAMPGLLIYAEYGYSGEYDEAAVAKRFKFLFGADYEAFFDMEAADHVHKNDDPELAGSFLLYNDPLIGLLDYHVQGIEAGAYYRKLREDFEKYDADGTMFEELFEVHYRMLRVLELKADYGVRLKAAYDEGNRESLAALADEALEIYRRLSDYRDSRYRLHMAHNKPFGYEIIESYIGTMMMRFDTARKRIESYLSGELCRIEELESVRLPYDCNRFGNPNKENIFYMLDFNRIYTNSL